MNQLKIYQYDLSKKCINSSKNKSVSHSILCPLCHVSYLNMHTVVPPHIWLQYVFKILFMLETVRIYHGILRVENMESYETLLLQ